MSKRSIFYFFMLAIVISACKKQNETSKTIADKGADTTSTLKIDTGWHAIAPLPGPRAYATGFSLNGNGYVGGGVPSMIDPNSIGYNDMYMYDPAKNIWTEKNWLPAVEYSKQGRERPFSFVINNVAYAGGGSLNGPGGNDIESYDTVKNAWTTLATLGNELEGGFSFSVATSIGGRGYIFSYPFDAVDILTFDPRVNKFVHGLNLGGVSNISSDQWLGASDKQLLTGRGGSDADMISIDTANSHNYSQTFNEPSDGYEELSNKAVATYNGIYYKGCMYVSFGNAGNLYRYNFSTQRWHVVCQKDLGVTANVADFLIGGYLYIVGGNNGMESPSTAKAWRVNLDAYP